MIRRLSLATAIAWLALLMLALTVFAATINWGATTSIRDESGVTLLVCGDMVQLIRDIDGDGVDSPTASGDPGGGDALIDSSTICYGTFYPGTFSKNTPSDAGYSEGWRLYVRAWNANALSSATHYGNSPVYTTSGVEGYTLKVDIAYTDIPFIPTSVDLAYFTATSRPDHVLLEWETTAELNIRGFDLQRGVNSDGPWQKLNPLPIPTVSPGGVEGHAYSWADAAAPRGRLSYYRLDEVLMDGGSKPLAVTSVYYGGDWRFWLPLLVR